MIYCSFCLGTPGDLEPNLRTAVFSYAKAEENAENRCQLLLSRGWVSSAPTLPSPESSFLMARGTNSEVSGGLDEELLDETVRLKPGETATFWLNAPGHRSTRLADRVPLPRGFRSLCAREKRCIHRFTDILDGRRISQTALGPGYKDKLLVLSHVVH